MKHLRIPHLSKPPSVFRRIKRFRLGARPRRGKRRFWMGSVYTLSFWIIVGRSAQADGRPVIVVVPEYWGKSAPVKVESLEPWNTDLVGVGLTQAFMQQLADTKKFKVLDARLISSLSKSDEPSSTVQKEDISASVNPTMPTPAILQTFLEENVDAVVQININTDQNTIETSDSMEGFLSSKGAAKTQFEVQTQDITAMVVTRRGNTLVRCQPYQKGEKDELGNQGKVSSAWGAQRRIYEPGSASRVLQKTIQRKLVPEVIHTLFRLNLQGTKEVNPQVQPAAGKSSSTSPLLNVGVRAFDFDARLISRFPTLSNYKINQAQTNVLRGIVSRDATVKLVEDNEQVLKHLERLWMLRKGGESGDGEPQHQIDFYLYGEIAGFNVIASQNQNRMDISISIHLRAIPAKNPDAAPILITTYKEDITRSFAVDWRKMKKEPERAAMLYREKFSEAVTKAVQSAWEQMRPQLTTTSIAETSASATTDFAEPALSPPYAG